MACDEFQRENLNGGGVTKKRNLNGGKKNKPLILS